MTLERTVPRSALPEPLFRSGQGTGRLAPPATPALKVAYLVSQYPKVSHSFIRREIFALERRGWQVFRLSIRGWNGQLVDSADISERGKTVFVLKGGAPALMSALLRQIARAPRRFFTTLMLTMRMMRGSDRPFIWHLIYLAEACWISARLREKGISHIHAHFGTNPAEVAMLVGALTGIGFSVTIHGPEEFDRARAIHLGEIIRRASFVAAISSFGRSQLYRTVDQRYWDKIRVVHCGIDAEFSALDGVTPSQTGRLVCVGRLCEQKGQLLLICAAAALAEEGYDFKLVLVGDGEDRGAIEAAIARYNLGNRVEITGWADAERVRREILAARALVLPSFAEGLPVVLIEAMILGRPVLSTYIAGIPELVIDGETGWLFPAGSQDDLLAAMRVCLDAPRDLLRTMGEAARARALKRHRIDEQVGELARLFETAMRGAR